MFRAVPGPGDIMSSTRSRLAACLGRAHGVSADYPVLLAPGQYNEGLMRGLDYFLSEAGKRGLKVTTGLCSLVSLQRCEVGCPLVSLAITTHPEHACR
jgi:hypothetical protein